MLDKKNNLVKNRLLFSTVDWLTMNVVHCFALKARITSHLQLSDGIIKWHYFEGFIGVMF